MKLWSGRFSGDVDSRADDFNSSIAFDARLYREDIEGSMAHAEMLGFCGIIPMDDALAIQDGLRGLLRDIEAGKVAFSADAEDIHMNIETLLTRRIGDAGKRLHTARSRNDQVAVDMRLYVKKKIMELHGAILNLLSTLVDKAETHLDTIMPGYTHLQRAQPVTMGHYLMAYAEMLTRDVTRLEDCRNRMDKCPLGACALAGTTYPIDRKRTAVALGFAGVAPNSLDAVSDRDYCIELLSTLSILMTHLSRLSEEIVSWCSWEFGFAELDDSFATGSSIMPQKKNPDMAELTRGKTGRVYGSLMAMLTIMKGLPLAYNKDMQEDKEQVFDAIDSALACLNVFAPMVRTLTIRPAALRSAAAAGFINATDCADYLAKKGVPFRQAYGMVGKLVRLCIEREKNLETLELYVYKSVSPLFERDIYQAISLETCVNARGSLGGPSPGAVKAHIEQTGAFIDEHKALFAEDTMV